MATTKPTTDAADSKPASNPKAKAKATAPVLLFNERSGFYTCEHLEALSDEEKPKGVGAKSPEHQYKRTQIRVPPGLYLIDGDRWNKVKANGGLQKRIRSFEIVVVGGDDEKVAWAACFEKSRPNHQAAMIEHSADLATLKAISEQCELAENVAEILADQIAMCSSDKGALVAAKRANKAHSRRGRGPVRVLS